MDKTVNPNVIMLDCECGSEIIRIEHIEERKEYNFAMYTLYNRNTLWGRIKAAWNVLKGGEPNLDQMVISENEMERLRNWI